MDRASLDKLKIPELKAKCKELKLAGYSKLNKSVLVQKLLDHGPSTSSPQANIVGPASAAAPLPNLLSTSLHLLPEETGPRPSSVASDIERGWGRIDELEKEIDRMERSGRHANGPLGFAHAPLSAVPPRPLSFATPSSSTGQPPAADLTTRPSVPRTAVPMQKRSLIPSTSGSKTVSAKRPYQEQAPPSAGASKKTKSTVSATSASEARPSFRPLAVDTGLLSKPVPTPIFPVTANTIPSLPASSTKSSTVIPQQTPLSKNKTSFRPPQIIKPPVAPKVVPQVQPQALKSVALVQPPSLSFAPVHDDPSSVKSIILPPSLRSRGRVRSLALYCSMLGETERNLVAQTGKVGRYAVYLSALHRLQRNFPGARLTAFLAHASVDPSTANLWPYLLARTRELVSRRTTCQNSWLGEVWSALQYKTLSSLDTFDAVSCPLYASPDDPNQLRVALRFVLARLHSLMAVVQNSSYLRGGGFGRVVGVSKVVEEVWRIDMMRWDALERRDIRESFLILEATGEPLGQILSTGPQAHKGLTPFLPLEVLINTLRPDWRAFVLTSLKTPSSERLLDKVQTLNEEEFPFGVHARWWNGPGQRGASEEGRVATSYVLSSCELQSVSGTFMTAAQMADQSNGLASTAQVALKTDKINLFLPSAHHVLSVHLSVPSSSSSSSTVPLHPSLALVQREENEPEVVLRETCGVVGAGLEGVSEVWRAVLGCDERGVVRAS